MVPVNIYDFIKFSKNNSNKLGFRINGASFSIENEENLVVKAIKLFEKKIGKKIYLDVTLEKRIPSGAGLGGGSGNAAGTLCALNYIFRDSPSSKGLLSHRKLSELAIELGSDVPFFLEPVPSEIFGRGDKLRKFKKYPKFFVIIIKPSFSISTSEAYKKCYSQEKLTFPVINSLDDFKIHMSNEFEKSLLNQYPILSEIKSLLVKNGAFGALVSGSGSAVFGAFKEKTIQYQAYKKIACLQMGDIFSCETLSNHYYF
tara:strand:- start:815 stop:1588 length:774 start_codon:yes stop_codon:yes gene_type:complete